MCCSVCMCVCVYLPTCLRMSLCVSLCAYVCMCVSEGTRLCVSARRRNLRPKRECEPCIATESNFKSARPLWERTVENLGFRICDFESGPPNLDASRTLDLGSRIWASEFWLSWVTLWDVFSGCFLGIGLHCSLGCSPSVLP